MKKVVCSIFYLIIICIGFVIGLGDSDTLVASADILAPTVGVEVPDSIDFGNVVAGGESEIFDLYITNTGNVAITVTPELLNKSEEIFSYLFFRKVQTDPFVKIGDFSVDISKPDDGEIETQRTYVILNLEDFDGEITEDIFNYQTDVIFWALPQ